MASLVLRYEVPEMSVEDLLKLLAQLRHQTYLPPTAAQQAGDVVASAELRSAEYDTEMETIGRDNYHYATVWPRRY